MVISLTVSKVDAYFARFHFLLPVIDKPFFLRKFTNIMDNSHNLDVIRSETAFLSLLFAVFACAANLVQDSRLSTSERHDDGGMGMVYYERYVVVYAAEASIDLGIRALVLQYISHPSTQIAHVQCFILMSSFLCSVNCLPQAWILIGQAVRTGQDLGLHVSIQVSFKGVIDHMPLSGLLGDFSSLQWKRKPDGRSGGESILWIAC